MSDRVINGVGGLQPSCSQPWTSRQDDFDDWPAERGGPGGYLLAWLAALVFCAGLVGLAVLPPCGVPVPHGFVRVCAAGCAGLVILAMFASRPGPQPPPSPRRKGADED
jgi:hypothetical protein